MREIWMAIAALVLTISMGVFASYAKAMEITCYSQSKEIYHGKAKDVRYADGILLFMDSKTNKRIFVDADCIVMIDKSEAHHPKKKQCAK